MPRPLRKVLTSAIALTSATALASATVLAGSVIPATAAYAHGERAWSSRTATASAPGGTVSTAVSVNDHDGTSVFHLSFRIARRSGAEVDVSNVAVALSDCTDCQSVAIAFQIDLVSPVPAVLTASNTAVAVNVDCEICNTLAAAFQYVVATPTPVRLTPTGRVEIHRIEWALERLGRSHEDAADIEAQVQALAAELSQVLSTELLPAPVLDHHWGRR